MCHPADRPLLPWLVGGVLVLLAQGAWAANTAKIAVQIDGISNDAERANVEAWLGFAAEAEHATLSPERVQQLHADADAAIAKALAPYGYYAVSVQKTLSGSDGKYQAHYQVSEGEPLRWIAPEISLSGDGATEGLAAPLLARSTLAVGRRAVHADYDRLKTDLVTVVRDAGYLDATLTHNVLALSPAAHTAQAQLSLDTGPRYSFGAVSFVGDLRINEALLRRYLSLPEGQPYSPTAVLDSQFALSDLDYFSSVEIIPTKGDAGGAVPLTIKLVAKTARRDAYGVGYGTDTGARASVGTDFRRLNRAGHKLAAELRVSEKQQALSGNWRIPQGDRPGQFLSLTGTAKQELFTGDATTRDFALGAELAGRWQDWNSTTYLKFVRSFTDLQGTVLERLQDRVPGETTLLTPGISLSRSRLNDPINATRGIALFVDIHGALQGALSDVSFLQTRLLLRGVVPAPRKIRLSGRVEYGANLVQGFSELPLAQRFFAGGDDSVRGYGYRDIGPRSAGGRRIGGKFLLAAGVEAERAVYGPYGAALFWDVGGAGDTPTPLLHHGIGLGFRYSAPFGAVRVDLAHPLDDNATAVRLHLGIRVGL